MRKNPNSEVFRPTVYGSKRQIKKNKLQRSDEKLSLSNSPIKKNKNNNYRSDSLKKFRKYTRRRLRANNEYVAPNSSNSSLDGVLKSVSSKRR